MVISADLTDDGLIENSINLNSVTVNYGTFNEFCFQVVITIIANSQCPTVLL